MYEYAANLVRVIDGDTVCVDIDLGFTIKISIEFRLLGINAPEMHGATKVAGQAAKDHLTNLLSQGTLTVQSEKPLKTDKYGRYLASVTVTRPDGSKFNVNSTMIADGQAVAYNP